MVGSKKQNILLLTVICCATLALISITWAAFSSTLKLSGQASVTAQSWDIDFTNTVGTKWTTAQTLTGTKTNLAELPTSSSGVFGLPLDQTASGFLGSLRMSGDKITYTWYVQNFGTFEAKYSISGLISTSKYLSGSNVDITCNTSDNSTNKTFCNNYVKTTLTIDGVVASPTDSYTLAKAGQTGDSSTLVLTIEIIGENQIYTATAGAFENRYSNTSPSMLLGGIEMLDSSNDLNISVTGLTLSGTQSVAETTPAVTTTKKACSIEENTEYLFDYTGGEQIFTTPCEGTYKLEVWGAQGGQYNATYRAGYGAYSVGEIKLSKNDILYINVGGSPINCTTVNKSTSGGYNGGGSSTARGDAVNNAGGGATHIAFSSGLLSTFKSNTNNLIMVAAGGGGAGFYSSDRYGIGGSGGGITGSNGAYGIASNCESYGLGGTQTSGGKYFVQSGHYYASSLVFPLAGFGFGGAGDPNVGGSGGGAGFYGGRGTSCLGGGGGGSSYIGNLLLSNKSMYCYNCSESNDENTKTISNTCVNSTATSECSKTGNGYAKITYLG